MNEELTAAIVDLALQPQRIRDLYYCRLCSAITSSRETQESTGTHRIDCPKRAALEMQS